MELKSKPAHFSTVQILWLYLQRRCRDL